MSQRVALADLRDALEYDPETGFFTWKAGRARAGRRAGSLCNGYIRLTVNNVRFSAQQAAWLYMNGTWPTSIVDHVNRDPSDNRIENLRMANRSQNRFNSKVGAQNISGFKGVNFDKRRGNYRAGVKKDGKLMHIGMFPTAQEAAHAYNKAAIKHYGEFAVLNPIGEDYAE